MRNIIKNYRTLYRDYSKYIDNHIIHSQKIYSISALLLFSINTLFIFRYYEYNPKLFFYIGAMCIFFIINYTIFKYYVPKHPDKSRKFETMTLIVTFTLLVMINFNKSDSSGIAILSYIVIAGNIILLSLCTLFPIKYFIITSIFMVIDSYITYTSVALANKNPFAKMVDVFFDFFVIFVISMRFCIIITRSKYSEFAIRKKIEIENSLDMLSKLYNRHFMEKIIKDNCNKNTNEQGVILMIDIDNFKAVNDTFGHIKGDETILYFSNVLKQSFDDCKYIARLGGDEFMIYYPIVGDKNKFLKKLDSFISMFPQPISENGRTVNISSSIGVLFFYHKSDAVYQRLYEQSDNAMYSAKNNGKNQYHSVDYISK